MSTDVTAVVLVGGRSTRMGRDKAMLILDGRTLTEHVLAALAPAAAHALLAGRPLPNLDVPAISEQYPDTGPLGGITSALDAVETPLALVAACDMPSIQPALLTLLLDTARADPDAAAVMCRTHQGLEPLLSAWRPALARAALHAALEHGTRSLRDAVAALPHPLILSPERWRPADPDGRSFHNWNTPADVAH